MTSPPIARIILYVKDIPAVARFYERFFNMSLLPGAGKGWLELAGPSGGCTIALHQAAKSQKSGSAVKIVFAVANVEAFVRAQGREGLNSASYTTPTVFNLPTPKIRRETQ